MPTQFNILCQETTLYNAWNIVKEKGAAGGIDGVTIQEFEKDKRRQIPKLAEELMNKTWKPYPYLEIEIAKDKSPEEKRKLGMTAIRDKIVQLAIKTIVEPRYDRIFVGNSYGYRPGKGATKAIRRVLQECKNKKYKYVLRLDIDNFFDTIDHLLLRKRLVATGTEEEIVRLIMLCIEMGKVRQKSREWIDTMLGTPHVGISFLSTQYKARKKLYLGELIADFAAQKNKGQQEESNQRNKKLIQQRKKEFRKLAAETSGLLVDKPGTFIGKNSRGVSISEKGKVIAQHHADNLSHVVVTGKGVSLSSNFISYCMERKIPIDFFDHHGKHIGSVVTPKYIQSTLWAKQSNANKELKNTIALGIIEGKIKNQHALLKYFNKYHKNQYPGLQPKIKEMEQAISDFKRWKHNANVGDGEFVTKLMGHEAQVAIRYWDYIRELIADDDVVFERREHQGATDLTNSMLNFGYAILYARVWQALLAARLNPFDSLIHATQEGKPTLAYDLIEIFRSQVVDRMVIGLIQKGRDLEVRNGLLTDKTRQMLVKSVMERLARYEKYQGEEMKMENIILRQAKLLAKAFEGTDKFKPYLAKW